MGPREAELPSFLKGYSDFSEHLENHFDELGNQERGDFFLQFACRLLPLSDSWSGFSVPVPSKKKSHDGGVDFEATRDDGTAHLRGQSKYKIRKVEEFDNVISKFANYEGEYYAGEDGKAFLFKELAPHKPPLRFLVVTSSKIENIVSKYEQGRLPSRDFYLQLLKEQRLVVMDGPKLLAALQQLYRRSYIVPPTVEIDLQAPFIKSGNTYISIINGMVLRELYEKHGSSLFFENIREFLGLSAGGGSERDSVNDDILATLRGAPAKMLERNNGITIKAEGLSVSSERRLVLEKCSIINGCQTTMCVALSGDSVADASLLLKIVVAENSWDVAKAANHQNGVARIDLDLARFLRPQLIRKVAVAAGYGVAQNQESTASNILEAIYRQKISYEEVRLLCLGLFSRFPNNLFASNYSELRIDILGRIDEDGSSEYLLEMMFRLLAAMRDAAETTRKMFGHEEYADLFKRFFREDNAKYRCFLGLLTACGCANDWLGEKGADVVVEVERIFDFLKRLELILSKNEGYFRRVFHLAFEILADKVLDISAEGRDAEILQRMYKEISGANFKTFFRKLKMRMDGDPEILRLREAMG